MRKIRARRTRTEACRAILQAAETRLIRGGPEAIRLQDIAADLGISHPTILHHFGSREKLLAALGGHAIRGLQRELLEILATRQTGDPPSARAERAYEMFERIHRLFAGRGYARLFAGLLLSGRRLGAPMRGIFSEFARTMHENRIRRRSEAGRPAPSWEETTFGLTLVWIALFGDALFGPIARATVDLPGDPETGRRFRRWMADSIEGNRPGAPREAPRAGSTARRRRGPTR